MKEIYKTIKICLLSLFAVFLMTSCSEEITDFGNDRAFSGVIKDQLGNAVHGTITKDELSVFILGEDETQATVLRVNGDGIYQNTKLFPKIYKAWLKGPVFLDNPSDTITLDFTRNQSLVQDWAVTPYLSIATPEITSGPTATSAGFNYSFTGNNGKTASKREIYCSTSPFPDTSRGSGYGYQTVKKSLTGDSGVTSVTGLTPNTKYYVRIGGSADGTAFNYSDQVIFTTPAQ